MNWSDVLEGAIGNLLAEIVVVFLLGIFVTKFLQVLAEKKETIGMFVLIDAEIGLNRKILQDMRYQMIPAFESEMKRGKPDELPVSEKIFTDAARFFQIPTEGLLHDGFYSMFSPLVLIENQDLSSKVVNFYILGLNYRIKTGLRCIQLNWNLLDEIKKRLDTEIGNSEEISREISKELEIVRGKNIYKETFRELFMMIRVG